MNRPVIRILGCRGIPARHGGFETFAERLALHLASRDWDVTVYCQQDGPVPDAGDTWNGVRLVHIPVTRRGRLATIDFDVRSIRHCLRTPGLVLTLGYGTGALCFWHRLRGRPNLINMDGIEWRRQKWSTLAKVYLYLNERLACLFGSHLIADHPSIHEHLATRVSDDRITMIPYGSDRITAADPALIAPLGLTPGAYAIVIARAEPENSILEMVQAFSQLRTARKLVVLGNLDGARNPYHARVLEAAGPDVVFPGAIYDRDVVGALRFHACLYLHGHQVGGTNPSLVEAMGAGNPVLAHDNPFNRWVAGPDAAYFADADECAARLRELLVDGGRLQAMTEGSRARHAARFTWPQVLNEYESLLLHWQDGPQSAPAKARPATVRREG